MTCPRCNHYNRRVTYVPIRNNNKAVSLWSDCFFDTNVDTFERGYKCGSCSYIWPEKEVPKPQKKIEKSRLEKEINNIKTMGYRKGPYKPKERYEDMEALFGIGSSPFYFDVAPLETFARNVEIMDNHYNMTIPGIFTDIPQARDDNENE